MPFQKQISDVKVVLVSVMKVMEEVAEEKLGWIYLEPETSRDLYE